MEVLNPRAALLSNFEVLTLLRELENEHLARTKTALRIKKEEESSANLNASLSHGGQDPTVVEINENLRTVEVEAIQYLSGDFQPTSSQSPEGISNLVHDLSHFELTKAEKLQIVNLAPTEAVELYVIVEELEDRLGERMDDILTHVQTSLHAPAIQHDTNGFANGNQPSNGNASNVEETWDGYDENADGDIEAIVNDTQFDDTGEGAGVEGDLDMDDD